MTLARLYRAYVHARSLGFTRWSAIRAARVLVV